MDRDGCLNILNLLHLHKHFDFMSILGQEIYHAIDYYMEKSIWSKSVISRMEVTQEIFLKITDGSSCIRNEIRRNFLGIKTFDVRHRAFAEHMPKSVLTTLPAE